MHWRTKLSKAKQSLGKAYNTSRKILSIADRAHAMFSQNFNRVQDRFDPEVRQSINSALQTYGRQSRRLNAIDASIRNLGDQVQQTFPGYL